MEQDKRPEIGFLPRVELVLAAYKDVLKNCHFFHIKSHLMSKNSVHSNSIEVIRPDFHVGTRN